MPCNNIYLVYFTAFFCSWLILISFFIFSLSFTYAEAACQTYGSACHLVSILSFEENREVFAEFEKRSFIDANTNLTDFFWMGLTNQPFIKGKNISNIA